MFGEVRPILDAERVRSPTDGSLELRDEYLASHCIVCTKQGQSRARAGLEQG